MSEVFFAATWVRSGRERGEEGEEGGGGVTGVVTGVVVSEVPRLRLGVGLGPLRNLFQNLLFGVD